jgi:hypothetical protein
VVDAISPHALSELIGSICDCALDPCRWEHTLSAVMDTLDCHKLALTLTDLRHHRHLLLKTAGMEPYQIERFSKYIPEMDAIRGEALASWPSLDEPYVVSRHQTTAYIETSPYFQEHIRPNGTVDIMEFFLMRTPKRLASLGVGRHRCQGTITEREIGFGKLLLPHLRRAVMISRGSMSEASRVRGWLKPSMRSGVPSC